MQISFDEISFAHVETNDKCMKNEIEENNVNLLVDT